MRTFIFVLLSVPLAAFGCGGASTQTSATAMESPEQASERILARARALEQEHKTREAFAAYHQLTRNYAATPAGKQALARVAQAQKDALRRSVIRKRK